MIVEALIFPHLMYCLSVWAGCGKMQKHRVQKVVNHCAQVVFGTRRSSHVTSLLKELKWTNIDQLVSECDMSRMHTILNSRHAPVSLRECLVYRTDVTERKTRAVQAGNLQLPLVRSEHAKRFFTYRAVKQWNSAPSQVKDARTAAICRKRARKWIAGVTAEQMVSYENCNVFNSILVYFQVFFMTFCLLLGLFMISSRETNAFISECMSFETFVYWCIVRLFSGLVILYMTLDSKSHLSVEVLRNK